MSPALLLVNRFVSRLQPFHVGVNASSSNSLAVAAERGGASDAEEILRFNTKSYRRVCVCSSPRQNASLCYDAGGNSPTGSSPCEFSHADRQAGRCLQQDASSLNPCTPWFLMPFSSSLFLGGFSRKWDYPGRSPFVSSSAARPFSPTVSTTTWLRR